MIRLIPLIAFSGLLVGLLFKKRIKEEIKPGKKYFKTLEKAILLIIILSLLYFTKDYFHLFIGVITGFILAFILIRYFFLGFALATLFLFNNMILLITTLIFIYGIPYAALKKIRISKNFFFFLPFLIFLIPNPLIFADYFIGISTGALFHYLIKK